MRAILEKPPRWRVWRDPVISVLLLQCHSRGKGSLLEMWQRGKKSSSLQRSVEAWRRDMLNKHLGTQEWDLGIAQARWLRIWFTWTCLQAVVLLCSFSSTDGDVPKASHFSKFLTTWTIPLTPTVQFLIKTKRLSCVNQCGRLPAVLLAWGKPFQELWSCKFSADFIL